LELDQYFKPASSATVSVLDGREFRIHYFLAYKNLLIAERRKPEQKMSREFKLCSLDKKMSMVTINHAFL